SDPTRRDVFERLARAPSSVGALAEHLPVSRSAVSQHLKVLSDAGLVKVRVAGTRRIYAVQPERLAELRDWLDDIWSKALQDFAVAAEEEGNRP
ncbi:MAG: metalloregulator ArsR/SmtB family transcription factor, partial [Pseudomonadota bacterium]